MKQLALPWLFIFFVFAVLLTTVFYWKPIIKGYSFITNVDPFESSIIVLLMVQSSFDDIARIQQLLTGPLLIILGAVMIGFVWRSAYRSLEHSSEVMSSDPDQPVDVSYGNMGKKLVIMVVLYCLLIVMWTASILFIAPELLKIPLENFLTSAISMASVLQLALVIAAIALIFQANFVISVLAHRFVNS